MGESVLSIQNLHAWYNKKKEVLSGFSIELGRQEVVGLIGLNGAGKTTFLNTLSGLHKGFQCDRICFQGAETSFREEAFKRCRYTVFAEDTSYRYFTFWEYLSYVEAAYGKKLSGVEDLVQGFGFADYTGVLLGELSLGNRKKAYLITAFALEPELLLLDEPVNGLDFQGTEFLYQLIAAYKERGTVLFSSHILESITLTCDRVLVLEEGHIRQTFAGGQIDAAGIREALHHEGDI